MSSFVGSIRGRNRSAWHAARVSSRRMSSKGRTCVPATGSIPASPSSPQPRTNASSTVSARSSIVCPRADRPAPISAAILAPAARRSSRAHRSTESPGRRPRRGRQHVTGEPVRRGAPAHVGGIRPRRRSQSMIEMEHDEVDPEQTPQPHERLEQAQRVGTARNPHEHAVALGEHVVLANGPRDALEDPRDLRRPRLGHVASPRCGRSSDPGRRSRRAPGGSPDPPRRG